MQHAALPGSPATSYIFYRDDGFGLGGGSADKSLN